MFLFIYLYFLLLYYYYLIIREILYNSYIFIFEINILYEIYKIIILFLESRYN